MGSEIKIGVKAENDSAKAFNDLKMSANDVKGELTKLSTAAKVVREDISRLDASAAKSKQSLRELSSEFARAGSEAEKLKIADKMKEIESELTRISKAKKIKLDELIDIDKDSAGLGKFAEAAEHASKNFLQKFGGSVSEGFENIALSAGTKFGSSYGAAAAVAAVPILIGTMGALLSAGTGAAGIGGAVALAIKSDTGLQDAGKTLGQRLMGGLTQAAHTAFAGPIADTFKDLNGYVDHIVDTWKGAFENLAPSLRPLVNDLASAVSLISDALADVASNSGDNLDALGDGIIKVSGSIGDLIKQLGNAENGTKDLETLFDIMNVGIVIIKDLSAAIDWMGGGFATAASFFGPMGERLYELYDTTKQVSEGSQQFRRVTVEQAEAQQLAADAANEEKTALQGLADQLKAQTDPVFAVIDAQKRLNDAQAEYKKAVKDHGKNSREAADALNDLAKAGINMEGAVEGAAGALDGGITPALRATLKAAGLTDAQIEGVAKSFRGARKAGQEFEDNYVATIREKGSAAAIDKINDAKAAARAYEGQYIAALSVKISKMESGQFAHGGIMGSAHGAVSSGLTWVGENGPELIQAAPGSRVYSAGDSQRLAGDAYKGNPNQFDVYIQLDGEVMAKAMVRPWRGMIINNAGGSAERFFGSN